MDPTGTPQNNILMIENMTADVHGESYIDFNCQGSAAFVWKVDVYAEVLRGGVHHAWLTCGAGTVTDNMGLTCNPTSLGDGGKRWQAPATRYFQNQTFQYWASYNAPWEDGDIVRCKMVAYQYIAGDGGTYVTQQSISYREMIITSCELPEFHLEIECGTFENQCGWLVAFDAEHVSPDHVVIQWGTLGANAETELHEFPMEVEGGAFVVEAEDTDSETEPVEGIWVWVQWYDAADAFLGDAYMTTEEIVDPCECEEVDDVVCEPNCEDYIPLEGEFIYERGYACSDSYTSSGTPACTIDVMGLGDVVQGGSQCASLQLVFEENWQDASIEIELVSMGEESEVEGSVIPASVNPLTLVPGGQEQFICCVPFEFVVESAPDGFTVHVTVTCGTGNLYSEAWFCYGNGDGGEDDPEDPPPDGECDCCEAICLRLDTLIDRFDSLLEKQDEIIVKLSNIENLLDPIGETLLRMEDMLGEIKAGNDALVSVLESFQEDFNDESWKTDDYDDDGVPDYKDRKFGPDDEDVEVIDLPDVQFDLGFTMPTGLIERNLGFTWMPNVPGFGPLSLDFDTLPDNPHPGYTALRVLLRTFITACVGMMLGVKMYKSLTWTT